jgi:hypothetical protein
LPAEDFNRFPRATQAASRLRRRAGSDTLGLMFTIEHDFDATVVTLIDDAAEHRQEDVTVTAFEDCVTLEQLGRDEAVQKITLSLAQVADLVAALDLPEGIYARKGDG